MAIRLFIKGTSTSAKAAAKRRGVRGLKGCKRNKRGDAVFCDAPCFNQKAVAKWYGSEPTSVGRQLPAGSLLFYSARCPR